MGASQRRAVEQMDSVSITFDVRHDPTRRLDLTLDSLFSFREPPAEASWIMPSAYVRRYKDAYGRKPSFGAFVWDMMSANEATLPGHLVRCLQVRVNVHVDAGTDADPPALPSHETILLPALRALAERPHVLGVRLLYNRLTKPLVQVLEKCLADGAYASLAGKLKLTVTLGDTMRFVNRPIILSSKDAMKELVSAGRRVALCVDKIMWLGSTDPDDSRRFVRDVLAACANLCSLEVDYETLMSYTNHIHIPGQLTFAAIVNRDGLFEQHSRLTTMRFFGMNRTVAV